MLSPGTIASLTNTLEDYEHKTTDQVVIVTLPSLQGHTIEDFGYQLGRTWGIGQKFKNNGVLLIVAPKERKVRIEVGYGLEDKLTDANSSQIVQGLILPAFRAGNMEQGIVSGAEAILTVLSGGSFVSGPGVQNPPLDLTAIFYIIFVVLVLALRFYLFFAIGPFRSGGGFGGGSFGGFSGGGGGFGGGGCSGGW